MHIDKEGLHLTSFMEFPRNITKDKIIGRPVTNDMLIVIGRITGAEKMGACKGPNGEKLNKWRVESVMYDPNITNAFQKILSKKGTKKKSVSKKVAKKTSTKVAKKSAPKKKPKSKRAKKVMGTALKRKWQ